MKAIALALIGPLAGASALDWSTIPAGRWVPVPIRGATVPKVFHGGTALVAGRGVVMFFGSDTHHPTRLERGESNAVWRLDLDSLAASQDYAQDPKSTYRILADGQTETTTGRPWAMHAFGDVKWDPVARRVVVVSGELHARFNPAGRFPQFRAPQWWTTLRHSHWEYDIDAKTWQRMETGPAPEVFAGAMVWDSVRSRLVAHNGSATWELDRPARRWIRYDAPSRPGWHQNIVFDTYAGRILLLGDNTGSNTLYEYDPDRHAWSIVETTGQTLPANGAAIAYDTRHHVMLYLANDHADQYSNPGGKSVTFLYHSKGRRWERLDIPSPELYGLNYLMQYDPERNVFLHFERSRSSGHRVRAWAFRYR